MRVAFARKHTRVHSEESGKIGKKNVHAIFYWHSVLHGMGKVAQWYGVNVVFSVPSKLDKIYQTITMTKAPQCTKKDAVLPLATCTTLTAQNVQFMMFP